MKKKSLAQQVADTLMQMIVDEKIFRPGDRLPNENELSRQMGVSRATLREAIRILTSQGILEVFRGRGTYISSDAQAFCDIGLNDLNDIKVRLKDMFEARLLIEPELAAIACRRASDEEIDDILRLGKAVEEKILSGQDRTEADQAMHQAIVTAAHNDFMLRLLPIINRAVSETLKLDTNQEALSDITLRDHSLLLDFIKRRNAAGAREAMSIHIRNAIDTLGLNAGEEPVT